MNTRHNYHWTTERLNQLIDVGNQPDHPLRPFWIAFHTLQLETGERAGTLLRLKWAWLDWQTATLSIPTEATKMPRIVLYALSDETLETLRAIWAPEPLLIFDFSMQKEGAV
jgi:integrase